MTIIANDEIRVVLSNGFASLLGPYGSRAQSQAWPTFQWVLPRIGGRQAGYESHAASQSVPRDILDKVRPFARAMARQDPYTAGHQRRVARLAAAIAWEMGLPEHSTSEVYIAGLVHDVGKIYLPAEILGQPGYLTPSQMTVVKTHPRAGYEALRSAGFPHPVAETVLQHHERMDGSGYPCGLRGGNMLLSARIVAVADVVEATASNRPYRPARLPEEILDEVLQGQGVLYDPQVVHAVRELVTIKGYDLGGE
jgi:putative nucleotidyltransferase with HDIG domain